MDFRTVLRTVTAQWKLVAVTIAACLVGAIAVTMVQTKTYQASATILVTVPGAVSVTDAYQATQAAQLRLSSYAELASGRTVAQRAIDQLKSPLAAEQLMADTKVNYTPESMLFQLIVTDTDAKRAAALAGAMAAQFADLIPEVDPGGQVSQSDSSSKSGSTTSTQTVQTAKATIVEQPIVPAGPSGPVPSRNLALGLLAGILLGVTLALLRESADRTVRTRAKLSAASGLPVLAELPAPSERAPGAQGRRSGPDGLLFDEAVRGLRTRLTGPSTAQDRSFLVTAASPGEGATTTALNLALSFTSVGERVLLIEGDQKELANLLGVTSDLALTDLLKEGSASDDAAVSTPYAGLFAMTSDAEGARREFSTPALITALARLSAEYDRVVVDGPPALVTADAASFAAAVDATVLVVRSGATTSEDIEGALENLRAAGGKVVGTVLTDSSVSKRTRAAMVAYRDRIGDATPSADQTVRA